MAIDRYFDKFPFTQFNSTNAVDITRRVVFLNSVLKNPYFYYPYEITADERADQFSNRYYKDQYKSWILYLSNEIVDPYYEWYMNQSTFNSYINKKYGDNILASKKIKHYECNWENADNISISAYDALLPTLIKYWEPDYQNSNKIMSYKRKKIDQIISTNSIRSYTVSDINFKVDEICDIIFDNNTTGSGQVLSVANSTLYIQHTSGTTIGEPDINSYIYGQESGVNTSFSNSTVICNNLLPEEKVYWSGITYYQYETAKNEYNKTLKVLDNRHSKIVADNLKTVLK